MRIGQLADRFDGAGDRLTAGAAGIPDADPGPGVFGAAAAGRLGELGRLLHRRWDSALNARAREAAAHGARLTDTAAAVRMAERSYGAADRAARAEHEIEGL